MLLLSRCCMFFQLKYEENPASPSYITGKEKTIWMAFSHNDCGYSSLRPHQNLTGGSFLKIHYIMESETIPINISCCVVVKSI